MSHRYELDGVRALAIAVVVLSHVWFLPSMAGGWLGVDVFFVLSGYLITSVLLSEWDRHGSVSIRRFYVRRILRLYPALVVLLLIGALFYQQLGEYGTFAGYLHTAAYAGFYVENIFIGYAGNSHGNLGITWTLAMEEQFYIVWAPALAFMLRRGRSPVPWLIGATAASWAALGLVTHFVDTQILPLSYYRPDTRANELLLGCLLAFFLRRFGAQVKRSLFARTLLAPLSVIGLAGVLLFSSYFSRQLYYTEEEMGAAVFSALLLLGLAVAPDHAPLTVLLRTWPFVFLGKISYAVYLYFFPVLIVLPTLIPASWHLSPQGTFALEAVVMVALATLSQFAVERPFLALKDRFGGAVGSGSANLEVSPAPAGAEIGSPSLISSSVDSPR